jgi:peroxiredoxin
VDFSTGYGISGSEGSAYLRDLHLKLAGTRRRIDSLVTSFDSKGDTSLAAKMELIDRYNDIIRDQRNYSITFIIDHRQSLAALYALYQRIDEETYILNQNKDVQLMKITAHALDTLYPGSKHVKALSVDAKKLEMQLTGTQYSRLIDKLDSSLPELSLPDPRGDTISLSSLGNKAILVSFWASWNSQSVAHNLELKKIYERYHPLGFEIYQVSMDNDKESWLHAIDYDELPWINVSELSYPETYAAAIYNVSSLPTTFLVTPDGEVLGKNLTAGELDRKLAAMLQ